MSHLYDLESFVRESNRIEGILRDPTPDEMKATLDIVWLKTVTVAEMERFVSVCQPGAVLRRARGLNVRVGRHVAPPGGPAIEAELEALLKRANTDDPWPVHIAYETLHPFTDGNGRSGRALWLWRMVAGGGAPLGFLHHFYYQTLERVGR